MKLAFLFDPESLVFIGSRKIHPVKGYSDYVRPQLSSWTPLPAYDKALQECTYQPDTDGWVVTHKKVSVKAYNKVTHEQKEFADASLITSEYVIPAPQSEFDSWVDGRWQYDKERHRPRKVQVEREWRDRTLTQILNRIDQFQKDQSIPERYQTSTLKEADFDKLLADRKTLCDYPQAEGFPFIERPELSASAIEGLSEKI